MTRHPWRRPLVAGTIALTIVGTGMTASAAEDPANATADLIASVAPDGGAVVAGLETASSVVASTRTATSTLPLDPRDPVALSMPSAGEPVLEVGLPVEAAVGHGRVADDGTTVYPATDGGADAAVQSLSDGSVRLQTVTREASGPHEFTYTFGDGISPVRTDDGTIELVRATDEGASVTVATVAEPWAVDAEGGDVDTAYVIAGDSLVQVISTDASTTYPVVADPKITLGKNIYINFTKAETKKLASYTAYAALSAAICSRVPKWIGVGCAVVIGANAISIDKTFNSAKARGRCVQFAVAYGIGPLDGNWRTLEWKTIKCLS